MKINLFKRKINGVSEEEIRELIHHKNEMINAHIVNWDSVIKELIKQRGKSFSNAIKTNSLNKFEALLISGYADFIASYLNKQLKNLSNKRMDEYMIYEYLLNKSLQKVTDESDSTVYVMYHCDDDEDEEKLYSWYENRIGESVQFPNFLSSSRRKWVHSSLYLQIKTIQKSSGKYIAPLTNKEKLEEEVTFMSNTTFRITDVQKNQKTIFLSELPRRIQGNYLLEGLYHLNIRNKEDDHEFPQLILLDDDDG